MARASGDKARFLTGSTMRHVVVMTLTGSAGLVFMFLVDVATLFWVSQLGVEQYMAALGFAWTVQFFTISTSIGLMIASMALISRAIGQGRLQLARQQTTTAIIYNIGLQTLLAATIITFRHDILGFAGADGQTREDAARFLLISVPSLPMIAAGMAGSGVLRSIGDAWRAMWVTMSAGMVAMVVDPLFIYGFGLGLDGAAWGVVVSRAVSGTIGIWFLWRRHDMLGPVNLTVMRDLARPFVMIAAPAIATQLSTPVGNYILTKVIAGYGDAAVAGWAVVSRVAVLAFGGIFSLSGAIGGIVGQNYGAGQLDRVRQTFIDALIFCAIYTAISWAILVALRWQIAALFHLDGQAAVVLVAFMLIGAGGYLFSGGIFVSNAMFNNLGRPLNSTACNWFRDGVLMFPTCWAMGQWLGAEGVVYGQAVASMIAGVLAVGWAWRFVARVEPLPAE